MAPVRAALLLLLTGMTGACASPECKHGHASKHGRCLPASASDAGNDEPETDSGGQDASSAGDAGQQGDAGSIQCKTGFRETDGKCRNIDECTEHTASCSEHERCVDTDGAYQCDCVDGYTRDGDGQCAQGAMCVVSDANDSDGDGAKCDNCPGVPNPSQVDIDADGSGWACDFVTKLPRAFTDAAMKFDGTLKFGESERTRILVAASEDAVLLSYAAEAINQAGSSLYVDAADVDLAVLSGDHGITTRDDPVTNLPEEDAWSALLHDGSVLLGGVSAGFAIAEGEVTHPFDDEIESVEVVALGDDDLVHVATEAGEHRLYRWNEQGPEPLLKGLKGVTLRATDSVIGVAAESEAGTTLYAYRNGALGALGSYQGLKAVFSYDRARLFYCGVTQSGVVRLSRLGQQPDWFFDAPPTQSSCDGVGVEDDDEGAHWLTFWPCLSCALTVVQEGEQSTAFETASGCGANIWHFDGVTYAECNKQYWLRTADDAAFAQISFPDLSDYEVYVRSAKSQFVFAGKPGSDTEHEVLAFELSPAARHWSFVAPTAGPYDAYVTESGGLWLLVGGELLYSDGTTSATRLEVDGWLDILAATPAGELLLADYGQIWRAMRDGQIQPLLEDSHGKRLVEDWHVHERSESGFNPRASSLGRTADGHFVFQLPLASGRWALATWRGAGIEMPDLDDATTASFRFLEQAGEVWSAEDGTAWLVAYADRELKLLRFGAGKVELGEKAPHSSAVHDEAIMKTAQGQVFVAASTDDMGRRLWRAADSQLREVALAGAPWSSIELTSEWARGVSSLKQEVFCPWSRFAEWSSGACIVVPSASWTSIADNTSALRPADPLAALIKRDTQGNQYLVRIPR